VEKKNNNTPKKATPKVAFFGIFFENIGKYLHISKKCCNFAAD